MMAKDIRMFEMGGREMLERNNLRLNEEIEDAIRQWDGTIFGLTIKNMYENGTDYESICEQLNIDYGEYLEG